MINIKRFAGIMENPLVYRLWQAPFVRAKFAPIVKHNDMDQVRRVLDVGCGPGINTAWFADKDYVGLDINEDYIETARRRFGREFLTADVREYVAPPDARYDFILLNSLLHHIDTDNVARILNQLHGQLTPGGHVHIIELVVPERPCISRWLATNDRGDYPRPLDEWRAIFSEAMEPVVFEPFKLRACGMTLWDMVYFKGAAIVPHQPSEANEPAGDLVAEPLG